MSDYVKLKDLIGSQFTVIAVDGFRWKMWDNATSKMVSQDTYFNGSRKLYQVETDRGKLDMGTGQLGNLLEAVFSHGKSDLVGRTFEVKSNGKEGIDVRYFFNPTSSGGSQGNTYDVSRQPNPVPATNDSQNPAAPPNLPPIANYTPDQEPEVDLDAIPF